MKKITKYILIPLFLVGFGCSDFGDINVNPNASVTPSTAALLTNAQIAIGGTTTSGVNFVSGLYTQYFSQTQYTDNSLYARVDADWGGEFAGSLYDLQNIININSDPATAAVAALNGSNNNQIAIARILKAWRFSTITDRYGDIPYSEALTGNTQPRFDAQQDIYLGNSSLGISGILQELDEAVAQFDNNGNVKGDIIFGGDNLKWQRFANSLRLVLALRISKVAPSQAEAIFKDALNSEGGVMESNDDNLTLAYVGGPVAYKNPWFGLGADQAVSDVMADWLNSNKDQRRFAFGKATGGTLKGFPYGLTRDEAVQWNAQNSGWSLVLNDPWRLETSTLFVLTYADVLLARAEGAFKGWTNDNYEELYNDAIAASWEQWGVFDDQAYSDYISSEDIDITSGNPAEKLAVMRWVTFYPNGPQGWAEWRRTGFPILAPTPNAANTSKKIPTRFFYPSVEYAYNNAGVTAAAARMGGDNDAIKIWWDVD
jgi:hypothetical protein